MHFDVATPPLADENVKDILIVGAGVVGVSMARVLSRLDCSVAVIEKAHDVGAAASARNSGVIHAGLNYLPGSKRARFCMEGRISAS